MLKIKRLISLFLSFLLLVTVCGCKKNAVNSDNSSFIEEIVVYEEEESSTETVTSDSSPQPFSSILLRFLPPKGCHFS